MKTLQILIAAAALLMSAACGAGHRTLVSLQVSPQTAQASSSTRQEVQYTAQGTLDDKATRELSAADGLEWTSSNTAIATIDENSGEATCIAPGVVTITGTAPANLQLTINNGINNTSPKVSGTATLNCS